MPLVCFVAQQLDKARSVNTASNAFNDTMLIGGCVGFITKKVSVAKGCILIVVPGAFDAHLQNTRKLRLLEQGGSPPVLLNQVKSGGQETERCERFAFQNIV